MRQYYDPFEQLLAEVVCEAAEELTKPQPQDNVLDIPGECGRVRTDADVDPFEL